MHVCTLCVYVCVCVMLLVCAVLCIAVEISLILWMHILFEEKIASPLPFVHLVCSQSTHTCITFRNDEDSNILHSIYHACLGCWYHC